MRERINTLVAPVLAGLAIGAALLAYADSSVTAATGSQPLEAALKACSKQKTKSERKSCKRKASAHSKGSQGNSLREGTTSTGTTTTGRATTTGTTGTTTATTTGTTTGPIITGGEGTAEAPAGGGPAAEAENAKAAMAPNVASATQIAAGKALFSKGQCPSCHGPTGEGGIDLEEAQYVRAQTVRGVIEQLVLPIGHMPNFQSTYTFEQKEELGDYICVDVSRKCEESH